MITFFEANQARISLKMRLSQYAWYVSSAIVSDDTDGYAVIVVVGGIDNNVRKIVPPVVDGVNVRIIEE